MPGQGRVVEQRLHDRRNGRRWATPCPPLGETTFDVYLNERAFWRSVPAAVWTYRLGGYQVLKKWLSYRERAILDRPSSPRKSKHFTDTARRIGAILCCADSSDNSYFLYSNLNWWNKDG